ncbi:thioesterase family protein [soil metagenome]
MTAIDFTEALLSKRPVTVRRRVLWGECDPAAVVYTPRFADYAASARDWFMREGLGFPDRPHPLRSGVIFPMRAMAFDFSGFLAADDLFDMVVGVTAISTRTFTVEIVASHLSGASAFVATLTSVAVDSGTRKSVAIPANIRDALTAYSQGIL